MGWDVFICHSSEDKESFVKPLALDLKKQGLEVWYDDFTLELGDSLRRSIDRGLAESRFGIVVLSPSFIKKDWPQYELDGLFQREREGVKVILPIWHNITRGDLLKFSPSLADKLAVSSAQGIAHVTEAILRVVKPGQQADHPNDNPSLKANPVRPKIKLGRLDLLRDHPHVISTQDDSGKKEK